MLLRTLLLGVSYGNRSLTSLFLELSEMASQIELEKMALRWKCHFSFQPLIYRSAAPRPILFLAIFSG